MTLFRAREAGRRGPGRGSQQAFGAPRGQSTGSGGAAAAGGARSARAPKGKVLRWWPASVGVRSRDRRTTRTGPRGTRRTYDRVAIDAIGTVLAHLGGLVWGEAGREAGEEGVVVVRSDGGRHSLLVWELERVGSGRPGQKLFAW